MVMGTLSLVGGLLIRKRFCAMQDMPASTWYVSEKCLKFDKKEK